MKGNFIMSIKHQPIFINIDNSGDTGTTMPFYNKAPAAVIDPQKPDAPWWQEMVIF